MYTVYNCILVIIFVLIFIHGYRYYIQINNKDPDCDDYLNQKLFDINLSFCWWNISHIVIFLFLSYYFKISNIYDHLKLFLFGLTWFLMLYLFSKPDRAYNCTTTDTVYKNMTKPKYSDIIFNTFGQIIYIIIQMPLK